MLDKATDFGVRRVVHGTGPDGKSTVLEDSLAVHLVETPAFTIVDPWRINSTPASLENEDGLPDGVELTPPPGSAVFRMCAIAPDEWAGRPMQLPHAEADFPRSLPTLDELPLSRECRLGVVTNLCCQGGRVGTRRRYYLALDGLAVAVCQRIGVYSQ